MYLVIAEKPSVSRAIAEVIGAQEREDGYLQGTDCMVSWCFGHLAEYVSPDAYDEKFNQWRYEDLPIIPKDWKVTVSEDKKDQFYILKRLLNSPEIEYVVNACDAGREGELIFKHVYDLSGSKKPVKRLWISSLEDSAILDGMQHLRSAEEYRHLAEAAVCRSQADWLVGMNATRAYTTKYFKKLTVGRVQTPTLAMLVERAGQINNFQKEKYFNVELDCDGIPAVKPKIFDPDEAEQLRSRCQGSEAIVTAVKETEKKIKAPKLYDLTTLQREANRIYGMTAKQTLDTAQSLYEKKLITYPRTDSQHLTEDMEQTARNVVRQIYEKYQLTGPFDQPEQPNVKKVMNNSKVTDHHAIIPTMELASCHLGELKSWEEKILFLIAVHTVMAMSTKTHLFIRVSSVEANQEMLGNVPHRLLEDLAITYHIAVDMDSEGMSSTIITNELMERYGITQQQLHEDALKSAVSLLPPDIATIGSKMNDLIGDLSVMLTSEEREMMQNIMRDDAQNPTFIVVTNKEQINGAGAIFYPEVMENMGYLVGGDYFILPSSIHETLVLPDNGEMDVQSLKKMVEEVNATQVLPHERLTNEVYHYDTKDHVFEKADRFEKRQKEKEVQTMKHEKFGKDQKELKPKAKKHDLEL